MSKLIRRMLSPEPEVLWVPFALKKACRIVRQHEIDIVVVTAPPFSAFLIGNALKRRFPAIRYVADFRDEWITFYLKDFEYQSAKHTRRRALAIERETVESADLVVAVTDSSLREIKTRYYDQSQTKFLCIPNGFDPTAFEGFCPRDNRDENVLVTHVGTVYKTASPQFYLNALDRLPEEIRSKIETRFIGRISEAERPHFEGRKSAVRLLGFMPQAEALRALEQTDYLLLIMTNDISIPGKLYEYLRVRKPIIALSPEGGEVHQFIQKTQCGWCVDHRNSEAIQNLMRRLYSQKLGLEPRERRIADEKTVRMFERPMLVRTFAQTMKELCGDR